MIVLMGTRSDSEGEFEDAVDTVQTKLNSPVKSSFQDTDFISPSTSTAFTSELFQNVCTFI